LSEPKGCCCSEGGNTTCCGPERSLESADETGPERKRLDIDLLYLDLDTCTRCRETEVNLDEALAEVTRVLESTGAVVNLRKIHVQTEEQARELRFVSSPTIRVNGHDIQLEVRESLCESCGDICGEDMDCRVWVYQGKEYIYPPKALIVEAILRAVYGGASTEPEPWTGDVPDNLKRFFAALAKKRHESG